MRYALIALWMIGFVCLVTGLSEPPASAQVAPPSNAVVVTSNQSGTHFTVVGPYQTTREDAWQAALVRAQKEVVGQLQSEGITAYQPSLDIIRNQLLKQKPKEEVKDLADPVGTVRRIVLEITITPQQRAKFVQEDRQLQAEQRRQEQQARAQERMTSAGIILAGLVALLGAIAGYLRLDELTKGYYTGWLLTAAGLIGAAVAGVMFLLLLA